MDTIMNSKDKTIQINMETNGFEEAAEDIELIVDAMKEIPATVNIKAKDCEINLHTSNIINYLDKSTDEEEGNYE